MNNSESDFTQGSILGKLIPFMMPILGALILQAAYGAVDLLVVGRFGTTEGLSAVSTGSQVLNLVTFVITQFAMGVTVLIARYIGEKKPEQIGALIGGAIVVFTMISVVLFIVMIVFSRQIAVIMQAPKEAVGLTSVYVKICGSGIFFIVAYNLLSAIFRGLGDSKSPLIFVAVACVINIVGDLLTAIFTTDEAVIQNGYDYLKGFALETIVTAILFSMIGYFNGHDKTVWVMIQGLTQTLLVRLPFAYYMSIQPDASLTKIGLAAPVATIFGIVLNVVFYILCDRKDKAKHDG